MLQRNKQPFVLFQRAGTRNWFMRFSMGGQQIRKSLGTEHEAEAQRLATEIWHEANYRNKNGLLPQAKPSSCAPCSGRRPSGAMSGKWRCRKSGCCGASTTGGRASPPRNMQS